MFSFLITFFSCLVLIGHHQPVLAQGTEPAYESESYAADIRQLTAQYRGQLQEYRQVASQYQIAKQQYQQLETLASLEEALRTTQNAMRLRTQVLTTYLRLLRFELLAQPGIELSEKQAADKALQAVVATLKTHQQEFLEPLDKPELNQQAFYFTEELAPRVESAAYQALVNLKIGRLQTVYDKSLVLHEEMSAELATISASLESAARQRSFAENKRLLDKVQFEFDEVETELQEIENSRYESLYRQLKDPLNELYASLRRALTYLSELLEGDNS